MFDRIFWLSICRQNRKIYDVLALTISIDRQRFFRNSRLNFERRRERRCCIKHYKLIRIFFIWQNIVFCRETFVDRANIQFRNENQIVVFYDYWRKNFFVKFWASIKIDVDKQKFELCDKYHKMNQHYRRKLQSINEIVDFI